MILHIPFLRPVTTPLLETLTIPFLFIVHFFVSVVFFRYTVAFSANFLPTFSVRLLRLSFTFVAFLSLIYTIQVAFLPFFVWAVITVLPDFLAVILPLLETVAYLLAEELQLTSELYVFGFTVAFSVYVLPLYSVKDGLLSLIDVALTDGLSGVTGLVGSANYSSEIMV